jgi:outer membrane protein assembly factor BamB
VRLRWSQSVGAQGITLPMTIANGVVYAPATEKLYAFDANTGSARWSSDGIGLPRSAASVANGVVYVSTDSGLYALDATTGAKRWSSTAGGSAPTVANGVVYVSTDSGLYALDAATGAKRWSSTAGGSAPTVANGVVYVSTDSGLYALDATTGAKLWSNGLATASRVPAAANGVVYVATDNGLRALNATTGAELWAAPDGFGPLAVANGVVYVGGGFLDAYNAATGAKLWTADNGYLTGTPTVANGVVYIGAHLLYAYNAVTGARLWSTVTTGDPEPVIANGVVYAGGNALNAYSLPITTPQLLISPAFDRDFVFGDPYSDTRIYTITNIGPTPTSAIADDLSGPDAAHFRLTSDGCAGTSLAGGARCTITASFAPTRSGSFTAWLAATATAGGTARALLTATAQPFTISPDSKVFADTFAGLTSTAVFRLTNFTGGPVGPLTNTVTPGSGFNVAADGCAGKTIAAGTSCTIAGAFAPTDSVHYAGILAADAPGRHAEAYLAGSGLARLTVAPGLKNFGSVRVGTTASATFTVTNISPIPAGPIADAIGAASPYFGFDYFTKTSDNCAGHTLAANASCTLVVNFAPTANTSQVGALTFTAPLAGTATATLSGSGT